MSISEKQKLLDELKSKMEKDESLPLKKGATRLVFGVGNPDAKIICIGEGPGYHEDQKGEPFVGQAGKLLDKLLESVGLERKNVYITNVVHHRPPSNRDPEPEEIKAYGAYLDKIMEIINAKIIITLGRFSMAKFLPGVKISGVHGKIHNISWKGRNLMVFPMYHPAASLRNGDIMRQEKEDFLQMAATLRKIKEQRKIEEIKQKMEGEQEGLF